MTSQATIDKAIKTWRSGGITADPEREGYFTVRGSGGSRYRVIVHSEERTTCTCPHGQHAAVTATCYHALAVEIMLEEEHLNG